MELQNYLTKFNKKKSATKEQTLAEEIFLYFGKKLSFGRIMSMIKAKGHQFCFEIFKECKEGNNPQALFIWKYKQCIMEEIGK